SQAGLLIQRVGVEASASARVDVSPTYVWARVDARNRDCSCRIASRFWRTKLHFPFCGRLAPVTAQGGGFNWSMQHTRRHCGGRSVADEAKTADLLLVQPTSAHLGAVAQGGDAPPDRP